TAKPVSKHAVTAKHAVKIKRAAKTKFEPHQRAIDDARATEIQAALIKAGYLSGSPSGHWDQDTIGAMTKLQAANGWQTKLVPDSRALIKLGLGPSAEATESATPSTQATASLGSPASSAYAR
ncbi:MAG TPA: peptidoglycan-binding protein, partial [Acidobacteriaceae bacterium]